MNTLPNELIFEIMKKDYKVYYKLSLCCKNYYKLALININKYLYSIVIHNISTFCNELEKLCLCSHPSDKYKKKLYEYVYTHLSFDHIQHIINVLRPHALNLEITNNMEIIINITNGEKILDYIINTIQSKVNNNFICNTEFFSIIYGIKIDCIFSSSDTINSIFKSLLIFIMKRIVFYCSHQSIFISDVPNDIIKIIMNKSPETYIKLSECSKRYYQLAIENKKELAKNRMLYNLPKFCKYLQEQYCEALYPDFAREWHREQIKKVVLELYFEDFNTLEHMDRYICTVRGILTTNDYDLFKYNGLMIDILKYISYFK